MLHHSSRHIIKANSSQDWVGVDPQLERLQGKFYLSEKQYFASQKIKRVCDILVALFSIMLLSPILILSSIIIKLDSEGPVFFTQERWGKDGKQVKVYKFRSMYVDACDAKGLKQAIPNDPRITRFGAFLRKSNVDELPQLFNVFLGDMSLVGPRCHPIKMLAGGMLYEELIPHYHMRHTVRPGITGLAQVRGLRGPTVRPSRAKARIKLDLHYIRNFSLWLDLKIIYLTLKNELFGGSGF